MDLPAPVDQPGADPPPEPVLLVDGPPPEPPSPPAAPGREPTLATLQAEVTALQQRVDSLAGSFETVVRAAVAEEVERIAGELQRTVATLGRVLVRDLGRLNQILAQHRDAILAELQPSSEPAQATDPEPPAGPEDDGDPGDEAPPDAASTATSESEKGRNWRRRKV